MAVQAQIGFLEQVGLDRLMREIRGRVLVRPIQRLAELIFRDRRMTGAVDLADQMALRAADAVDLRIAALRLRHERLDLVREFVDVGRMASETERLILSGRVREVFIERGTENRRMDGPGERRRFPFLERPLMT